jgi:hypothetical protein
VLTLGQIDWLYAMDPVLMPYLDLVLSGEQSPETIAPRFDNLLNKYRAIQ